MKLQRFLRHLTKFLLHSLVDFFAHGLCFVLIVFLTTPSTSERCFDHWYLFRDQSKPDSFHCFWSIRLFRIWMVLYIAFLSSLPFWTLVILGIAFASWRLSIFPAPDQSIRFKGDIKEGTKEVHFWPNFVWHKTKTRDSQRTDQAVWIITMLKSSEECRVYQKHFVCGIGRKLSPHQPKHSDALSDHYFWDSWFEGPSDPIKDSLGQRQLWRSMLGKRRKIKNFRKTSPVVGMLLQENASNPLEIVLAPSNHIGRNL